MNIIQPAHMNNVRMGVVSACIWGMIGEICHCAIEIINGTMASFGREYLLQNPTSPTALGSDSGPR
jgi:hypothetical protein